MISIITASYNCENYIGETITSVLAQTYKDFELIIVDDGSTDSSVEVIKKFKDPRIKLFTHNRNKGLKETILTGLTHAKGDWIAFAESDDTLHQQALQKRIEIALTYPQVGVIFNDCNSFGDSSLTENDEIRFEPLQKFLEEKTFPADLSKNFCRKNLIKSFSSVMIKHELLQKKFFDTKDDALLDWWLYIHLAFECPFYYIDEKLTNWRRRKNSYIFSSKNRRHHFTCALAYLDTAKQRKDLRILSTALRCFMIKSITLFQKCFRLR